MRRREKLSASESPWLEFSPDGNHLAVAGGPYRGPLAQDRPFERSILRIYDLHSDQPPKQLIHPDVIHTFAWYPDGKTIAAGGWNANEIYVWDVPTGKQLAAFTGQKGGAPVLTINRTGDLLASLSDWHKGVRLWHAQTGQELLTLPHASDSNWVQALDGRLFACQFAGTKIGLREYVPSQVFRTFVRDLRADKHKKYNTPAVHPDGRLLAVSMESGVGLWDLASGRELAFLDLGGTESAAFDATGTLWTYGHKGLLRWPVRAAAGAAGRLTIGPPETIFGTPTFSVWMAVNRDGRVAAAPLADKDTLVFHRDRPGPPVPLRHGSNVRKVAVSPDGRFVATAVFAGPGAKVWEADTGKELAHLFPKDHVGAVAFTTDGQWLIVGWHWLEVGTWREKAGVEGWSIFDGCISGDGQLLACYAGEDGIALFDRAGGRRLARLSSPGQGRNFNMTFNRDGTQLIATDADRFVIHVWDLRQLRAELAALGLDWDAPPYPPEDAAQARAALGRPLQIRIVGAAQLLDPKKKGSK
jgi:WD40 repeat protein